VKLIPSIDLQAGRSRLVFWPGAATGSGAPTDRPERIARHFVELGAPMIHLVDLDGAQRGVPANTEAIGRVSREVGVPLQLAGGVDGPEQIELAFALGATRVVVPLWVVADSPELLRRCLAVAGDWLAVGVDGRPEKLAEFPWRGAQPSFEDLIGGLLDAGVGRLVVSHWRLEELELLVGLVRDRGAELQLAGGVTDANVLDSLREAGIDGLIVGEALLNGTIDYSAAA
jgi:phosphoribosylformimino-5-aminoimidazole carboxamide ribonucleotide (ProFAR) isomerase